jgi:hypothetical protein
MPLPKAKGAPADNFMDTSLMEEIRKSGLWKNSREERDRRVASVQVWIIAVGWVAAV